MLYYYSVMDTPSILIFTFQQRFNITMITTNTNPPFKLRLTPYTYPLYANLPVLVTQGPLVQEYLHSSLSVLDYAIDSHSKVFVVHLTLNFPKEWSEKDRLLMAYPNRFIKAMRSQMHTDSVRMQSKGITHSNPLYYVRCVERGEVNGGLHHHVTLMFNGSVYRTLGEIDGGGNDMYNRIRTAWASALGLNVNLVRGLVNFDAEFPISRSSDYFWENKGNAFQCLSYLSKIHTKAYGLGIKVFTTSRIPKSTS